MRVTRRGVEVPQGANDALIRRERAVAPVALNDPFPKKFKVYLESPTKFVVPLHWARARLGTDGCKPGWDDARGEGEDADLRFRGSLRAELGQHEAVAAVQRSWDACGGAMLCLAVGYGKVRGGSGRGGQALPTPHRR